MSGRILLPASIITVALGKIAESITYLDDSIGEGWDVHSVPYSEFKSKVKTGDLILTSSTSIMSITRLWTKSLWSHTGIAYIRKKDGKLYEWSSHNEKEKIANTLGVVCGGPQLVQMDQLAAENGTIYWRPVNMEDKQRDAIDKVITDFAYKLHFSDGLELLSYAGWPFSKIFAGYGGGMACTHIVAATYTAIGVMNLDRDISLYTPESFSDSGDAKWNVSVGLTKMVVGYDTSRLVNLPKK
jgi:hypothetical protein